MFSEELAKYDWEETTRQIQHKRPADVETALGKEHLTLDDFMALISPAAAAYLEPMAPGGARLLGPEGPAEPPIHTGTVRQDHFDVYSDVHHQLVHELLHLLRIQPS